MPKIKSVKFILQARFSRLKNFSISATLNPSAIWARIIALICSFGILAAHLLIKFNLQSIKLILPKLLKIDYSNKP